MEENSINSTPSAIREAAREVTENLLPEKSKELYKACYVQFTAWQSGKNTTSVSEETMLVYFEELSRKFKPSSIWSKYSMLRSTILNTLRVDIGQYKQLAAFLSKNSKGFESKKSETLQPDQVEKFLREAPDNLYLAIKVALILGIAGACRRDELKNITLQDIKHHENMVLITIPKTKNYVTRKFVVEGEFYEIFKKYEALRPGNCVSDRFFLSMRNGKCTQQVIGINTLGSMPKVIAKYLQLENAEKYTGHTFRRTSATILADSGADLMTLKRHGENNCSCIFLPSPFTHNLINL